MNTGRKIATCRKEIKLSQEELASMLGISRQAVSRWETGDAMPDAEKIIHLSRLFGVSTDYLLLDEVENPSPSALSSARLIALPMAENPDLQRRRFRIGFGISMLVIGLITILAALILAGIWSLYTTEWYTEWGPFGTALFHTWRLIPLLLGLVAFLVGGGVLLNEYWRIGSTSSQ